MAGQRPRAREPDPAGGHPQDLDLVEAVPVAGPATIDLDLDQLERRHIKRVLESEDGSVARAARRLGIQRNTLYQKIKKYGLER